LLGLRQLLGHRDSFCRTRHLEVVPATAKIDDPFVMRVLENANEHAVAQTLGVATKQLAGARAYVTRAHGLVARNEIGDRSPQQIECFLPREPLTRRAGGDVDGARLGDRRRRRLGLDRRLSGGRDRSGSSFALTRVANA